MSPLWIASRATGLVSLVLLTLVLVLGISVRRMAGSSRTPRFVWVGLHRNATLLATVLVGLHVLTVVTDSYVDVRWTDVVLPFVGHYRPFWLGLGTVSLDLMAVLTVTSLLRDRISRAAVAGAALDRLPVLADRGRARGRDRNRHARGPRARAGGRLRSGGGRGRAVAAERRSGARPAPARRAPPERAA